MKGFEAVRPTTIGHRLFPGNEEVLTSMTINAAFLVGFAVSFIELTHMQGRIKLQALF